MGDSFKKWSVIGVSIWALTAFIAWHFESTCGMFLSGACFSTYWDGIRWIVLLQWVEEYQTLLGGFAALGAGAFVLLAAKQTEKHAVQAENAKRKYNSMVACSLVADEFRDAQIQVSIVAYTVVKAVPIFSQTSGFLPALHAIDPMLGSVVSAQRRDIEEYMRSSSENRFEQHKSMSAKCYVVWHLLTSISDKLEEDGTYNLRNGEPIPAGTLKRLVKNLGTNPRSLTGLYSLFDWDK